MGRTDDNRRLVTQIEALAGEIEAWGMGAHCEVERMPVLAAARLLDQRLHAAVLRAVDAPDDHREPWKPAGTRLAILLGEEPDRRPRKGQKAMVL